MPWSVWRDGKIFGLAPDRVNLVCNPASESDNPTVTVIVPTRNSIRTLGACLASIRAQTIRCLVVVVDNESDDGTWELAIELADFALQGGPERSAQRNQGTSATRSPILGFIDSDMILTREVVEQALNAVGSGAGGVVVPEETIGEGYWTNVRAYERSLYKGVSTVEAARFFPREIFVECGGFDEMLTGPEDWDLSMRVNDLAPLVSIDAVIYHDEGQVRYLAACRRKAYYAEGLRHFARKHGGLTVGTRLMERPWIRKPQLLFSYLGLGLALLKTGEFIAIILSLLNTSRYRIQSHLFRKLL